MPQPQRHAPSTRMPHPDNPAERLAQADRVIGREVKRQVGTVERRKVTKAAGYRRRKGDR